MRSGARQKRRICSPIYHFTHSSALQQELYNTENAFVCEKESLWNLQLNGRQQAGFYQKVFCKKIRGIRKSLKEISGVGKACMACLSKLCCLAHFSLHTNKYNTLQPHFRFTYLKYRKNWQPIGSLCYALQVPLEKLPTITYIFTLILDPPG